MRGVAFGAFLAAALGAGAAEAPSPADVRREAEAVVFLLQYIAGDYPIAVEGGKVKNESEYEEQIGFVEEVGRRLAALSVAEPETSTPSLSPGAD